MAGGAGLNMAPNAPPPPDVIPAKAVPPSPLRGGVGGGGPSVDHITAPTLNPSPRGGGKPIVARGTSPLTSIAPFPPAVIPAQAGTHPEMPRRPQGAWSRAPIKPPRGMPEYLRMGPGLRRGDIAVGDGFAQSHQRPPDFPPSPLRGGAGGGGRSVDHITTPTLISIVAGAPSCQESPAPFTSPFGGEVKGPSGPGTRKGPLTRCQGVDFSPAGEALEAS
jgi:hypothetical protein